MVWLRARRRSHRDLDSEPTDDQKAREAHASRAFLLFGARNSANTMELMPLFLNLNGRAVVLVGGGRVAAGKLQQLLAVGARVRIVAPNISPATVNVLLGAGPRVEIVPRRFVPSDLDGAWLVVAAATPEANAEVAEEAEKRRLFVNAVDDPANASAYLSGVVRRDGVTLAISTHGEAPALTALLREALDAELPRDLATWVAQARSERVDWRRDGVPMDERKPRLLRALNALYDAARLKRSAEGVMGADNWTATATAERIPWLNGPEDSWL
jgi:siroheme synthase-like protein